MHNNQAVAKSFLACMQQVLLLAWKMEAQRMGFFSREEFSRGLRALNASTVDRLRKALPKLEEEVDSNPAAFSSFFTFAFKFCLTVSRARERSCDQPRL